MGWNKGALMGWLHPGDMEHAMDLGSWSLTAFGLKALWMEKGPRNLGTYFLNT